MIKRFLDNIISGAFLVTLFALIISFPVKALVIFLISEVIYICDKGEFFNPLN